MREVNVPITFGFPFPLNTMRQWLDTKDPIPGGEDVFAFPSNSKLTGKREFTDDPVKGPRAVYCTSGPPVVFTVKELSALPSAAVMTAGPPSGPKLRVMFLKMLVYCVVFAPAGVPEVVDSIVKNPESLWVLSSVGCSAPATEFTAPSNENCRSAAEAGALGNENVRRLAAITARIVSLLG
ncbi:MAG: hypothetical protein Q8N04_09940 [Nitrospira sp.]|nr:hypothetical protein [Nitrospira sp.]